MGIVSEFETYCEENNAGNLPDDFTQKYNFKSCLSCSDNVDTLLVEDKSTKKKIVAKCYKRSSAFYDAEEPAVFKEIVSNAIPSYEGEYKNEAWRCVCREYIEGTPLDEYVKKVHVTQDLLTEMAINLANSMKSLHDLTPAVIHRDIKPSNIIVRPDGGIVLIDLGISRVFKEHETADTNFWGTEEYAPPEQYGFRQTDVRSDIYSFGVVLTWLLTGDTAAINTPCTRLEKIAAKCRKFSPEGRYPNDSALLRALHRTTKSYKLHMRTTFKRLSLASLILVGILSIAVGAYHSSRKEAEVIFAEPLVEEAVRAVLGQPEGIITYKDLEDITGIYIQSTKACPSLEDFYVETGKWYGTAREDRAIGSVADLSDLKNMPNLRQLCIIGNRVRDLSPLKDLKYLQKLELGDNEIEDLSPLANKEFISEACLSANSYKNISVVSTWPAIKVLTLSETGGYDGSPIGSLKNMTELDIRNDTDAYLYLKDLYVGQLEVGAPDQTDLECIKDVAHVERLYIRWSNIHDISAIKDREDIIYLNMEGCIIEDLSPLFTLPNLASVHISSGSKEQMDELITVYGEPKFEVIYTY